MKKFIFYFTCYIGCYLSLFNSAHAENAPHAKFQEKPLFSITIEDTKEQRETPKITTTNAPAPHPKKQDFLKKLTAEVYKIVLTPFIIKKLYPNLKNEQDITPALAQLYPGSSENTLKNISAYTKSFLKIKERYDYAVNRLEQQIKAAAIIPEDELIVAADGEYISEFPEAKKQSGTDEYIVKYEPYKYIGYDTGELGEPVRRKDKNYQEKISNLDEVILAILKFDLPGFIRAINKLPKATDNSAEKTLELANGTKARLLFAKSSAGTEPKLQAVLEVKLPKEHYITGDILNPNTRPRFFLSEDSNANTNISSYELYLPEADGVVKDGTAKRILTDTVRFPLEIIRRDVEKTTTIKGHFAFDLCDKEGICEKLITDHEFTVKPNLEEELSIYNNYITQSFMHLPPEKSRNAELKSAVYDTASNTLTLSFKTSKSFSQIAVMVEDEQNTNYLNPRYRISANEVTATFDITPAELAPQPNVMQKEFAPLAITAMFNNNENLRIITTPIANSTPKAPTPRPNEKENEESLTALHQSLQEALPPLVKKDPVSPPQPKVKQVALPLLALPGIFYLFIRLLWLLNNQKGRLKILLRYAIGSFLGTTVVASIISRHYWSSIYENAALTAIGAVVVTSLISECMGYMNFAWFAPLKKKLGAGFFNGFFTVVLISAIPLPIIAEILSPLSNIPLNISFPRWVSLWFGLQILPIMGGIFPIKNKPNFFPYMLKLNIIYNIIYLIGCLWLIFLTRGEAPMWLTICCLGLVWGLWYIYPKAITETIRHTKSEKRQRELYHKVERHALIGIVLLSALTYAAINSYPVKKALPAPTPTEVIKNNEQTNMPTLVVITAPWSIIGTINTGLIKKLENTQKLKTIVINAIGEGKNAAPWFATYNTPYAPLNVLYTKRHPYGLVLPNNLTKIDWEIALDTFEVKPKTKPSPFTKEEIERILGK